MASSVAAWPLLVAVALATSCRGPRPAPAAEDAGAAVRVNAVRASEEVVPETLASTGTLVGARQADLAPLVPGRITRVHIEIGDRVAEGEPILELRKDDLRAQASAAESALAQARARAGDAPEALPDVEAARLAMDRAREDLAADERLFRTGAISEQALEQSRTRAKTATAQYEAASDAARAAVAAVRGAEAQAEQAARAVSDATLRAPFGGEIAEKNVTVGEYVTPQSKVVRLVEVDVLRVKLAIPQEKVPLVQVGQPVTVRVDARPDRAFEGTVKYISAAVDPERRVLEVEADVPNPEGALRPGFFVRGEIALPEKRKVTVVPASALVQNAETYSVFVVEDGRAVERVVELSSRDGDAARIASGVRPGEEVIVSPPERLRDGAPVER